MSKQLFIEELEKKYPNEFPLIKDGKSYMGGFGTHLETVGAKSHLHIWEKMASYAKKFNESQTRQERYLNLGKTAFFGILSLATILPCTLEMGLEDYAREKMGYTVF